MIQLRLSTVVALTLMSLTPALACLHSTGSIVHDPLGINSGISATVTDNGGVVCTDANSRIDQDGHYSLGCIPGYVYAVTKDARTAWYGYGSVSFQFLQDPSSDSYDCYGACDDKKGACIQCDEYSWDVYEYC
jgi:hypothetical protein